MRRNARAPFARSVAATRKLTGLMAAMALLLLAAFLPAVASAADYELSEPPSFCSSGTAAGQCALGTKGVALDQSNGNVYLADGNNGRIEAFDSAGNFLWAAGRNVRADAPAEQPQVCTAVTGCKKGKNDTLGGAALGEVGGGVRGLAVDPTTHIVYIAVNFERIKYFDGLTGAFLGEFNASTGFNATGAPMAPSPTAPSAFTEVGGVAIDTSSSQHYLYVAASNVEIDKFKVPVVSGGTLVTQASYVCQITGKETASATECHGTASKDGAFNGLSFASVPAGKRGGYLAVDSTGGVIFAEADSRNTVSVFDSSGGFVKQCAINKPEAVAAGPAGRIYVAVEGKATNEGGTRVREYDLAASCVPISDFGLGTIGAGAETGGSLGLAVDLSGGPSNGHVYVSDSSSNARIWNYELALPAPPKLKEQQASNVAGTTVELSAMVHAKNAAVTDCHFEYVTQTAFASTGFVDLASGGSVPCAPPVVDDHQYHLIEGEPTGLLPETPYRWRTVVTNSQGTTNGDAEAFETGPIPETPIFEEEKASAIKQTTVTLEALINPKHGTVSAAGESFPPAKDCEFRYTTDPGFVSGIQKVPCQSPANLGGGPVGVLTSSAISGLAPNTTYYWRVYAANQAGNVEGPVKSLVTLPEPPTVSNDPVGVIGETTTALNAHVNNNGATAGSACSFQVARAGDTTFSSPVKTIPCDPPNGPTVTGSTSKPVGAVVTGLLPKTAYLFRALATNNGGEGKGSPAVPFTTTAPPDVTQSAIDISGDEATLVALITPNGLATTYHLEYVDDAHFQSEGGFAGPHATKTSESASIGADHAAHEVTQQLEGLSPGTLYHYRFVAGNSAGTSEAARTFATEELIEQPCANDARRSENDSLGLPNCRAYEMVSPPWKNLGSADASGGPEATVAFDGRAFAFCTSSQFGDPPPQNSGVCQLDYLSRRTSGGWKTTNPVPGYCPRALDETAQQEAIFYDAAFSGNLDHAVINRPEAGPATCPAQSPLDPAAPLPARNLYLADLAADSPSFALLAPEPAYEGLGYGFSTGIYAAASDDFSHVVFRSSGQQTADAPAGDFDKLFDWHEGTLSLVSRDPNNNPFATPSTIPFHGLISFADGINVVSNDGSRIFFENGSGAGGEVYLRENAAVTHRISESECTAGCGSAAASTFEWASTSGDRAFLRSAAKLTDEDTSATGRDLYLYTQSPDPETDPHNLTLVSRDNELADGDGADVLGVIGMSSDGDIVYFAAAGQIVPGAPTAPGAKIYRWRWNGGNPSVDYLATLDVFSPGVGVGEPDEQNWSAKQSGSQGGKPVSRLVTPDGAVLLIQTVRPLDPIADGDDARDVYRWTEQEGWACVSCQAPTVPSVGEASVDAHAARHFGIAGVMHRQNSELRVPMSDDGKRIFFTAYEPLVPEDINGVEDVYQWEEGRLSLISSGRGSQPFALIGAGNSGDDVFFVTAQALVGADTDHATDYYDARVDGGFPAPAPAATPCQGESCRERGTDAPLAVGAASAAPGEGNPPRPRPCRKRKLRKRGRCVARKPARHNKSRQRRGNQDRRNAK